MHTLSWIFFIFSLPLIYKQLNLTHLLLPIKNKFLFIGPLCLDMSRPASGFFSFSYALLFICLNSSRCRSYYFSVTGV